MFLCENIGGYIRVRCSGVKCLGLEGSGILCLEVLTYFYLVLLILLSGDIELDPGPNRNAFFKFCHWNLNSLCAREQTKNFSNRGLQFKSSL